MGSRRNGAVIMRNYATESRNPVRFDERYPYHVFDYNISSRNPAELLINRSTSRLDERSEYPSYQLRGEHATFYHPYYRPERFSVRRDISAIDSFNQRHPNSFDASATYRRNLSRNIGSRSFQGKFNSNKRIHRSTSEVIPLQSSKEDLKPMVDNKSKESDRKLEEKDHEPEENNENPIMLEESESCILSYCLDRNIQHVIHRLQNDFRLTKSYKSFVMEEMPLITDFKPTPSFTANKLHDRFKCLNKELVDVTDAKIELEDLSLEVEIDAKAREIVLESVEKRSDSD